MGQSSYGDPKDKQKHIVKQCHMLFVKQAREPTIEEKSLQKAELASQALDLDSFNIRDEHRSKKPKAAKHTETL
ncbi:hypothetical protein J1N35_018595 [Gossypium stocksii]|uniref:Uncharacterized protein n=1 Tax=Gossypium stocksii TaxID=47602 RepID=A0A9D3VRH9_9ROSI|nr:hypothetical protein J1N35_018595 [Gossypium stocksii]